MPTKIATMTHMMIESPADVEVSDGDDRGRYTIYFRCWSDDPLSCIAFSGSPASIKAAFANAMDLLDRAATSG